MDLSVFLQNSINIACARALPLAFFRPLLYAQGILYYCVYQKEFYDIIKALHWALRPESRSIRFYVKVLKTFAGVFEHYIEKLITAYLPLDRMIKLIRIGVMIEDKKYLDEALSAQKGCLLVTGHFGAVEFFPLTLAANGYKVAMILNYKTSRLKQALLDRALRTNIILIDSMADDAFKKAINILKQGMILVTVCDEFKHWKRDINNEVSVFGCSYPQDKTLDIFFKRARAPIVLGLIRRDKTEYRMHIQPIGDENTIENVCKEAWTSLEDHILHSPEQWYNWQEFSRVVLSSSCWCAS